MTNTCPHCNGKYEVPEGFIGREEHTCDYPPPAKVGVWKVAEGESLPKEWTEEYILHYCEKGVEKPIPFPKEE